MTNRKPATAPVIDADIAFGNRVTADRDAAVIEEARLREEVIGRESYFDREQARLIAERDAEINSLKVQIEQQVRVIKAADAALESLTPAADDKPALSVVTTVAAQ